MTDVEDRALVAMAERIVPVDGVVAVVLGGSRARGTHRPDSDVDLGLYYRGDLDVLTRTAVRLAAVPMHRQVGPRLRMRASRRLAGVSHG